jgi:hypothetical protein
MRRPVSRIVPLLCVVVGSGLAATRTGSTPVPPFDGRASRMTFIDPVGGSGHQEQQPAVWDCLCYVNGNVKLVPDSRFGKAYRYSTDDSSWNGAGYDPGPNSGTSDLGERRPQGLGHWDWYALAVKAPRSWRQPTWALVFEVNFPAWTSPPEGLEISPRQSNGRYCWTYSARCRSWFDLVRNVGEVGSTTHEHHWLRQVEFGKWTEFVIGINWQTSNDGAYQVYTRVPAHERAFRLAASAQGVVTYQTKPGTPPPATTTDLQFLYEGTEPSNGWPSPLWRNTIYHRGFQRFSTRGAAIAALNRH